MSYKGLFYLMFHFPWLFLVTYAFSFLLSIFSLAMACFSFSSNSLPKITLANTVQKVPRLPIPQYPSSVLRPPSYELVKILFMIEYSGNRIFCILTNRNIIASINKIGVTNAKAICGYSQSSQSQ